jgi:hypothetical protein
MTQHLAATCILLALLSPPADALAQTQSTPVMKAAPIITAVAPPAASADVATSEAVVAALYDVISGPIGKARDWDRLRSLFAPGARMLVRRAGAPGAGVALSVEDYIARVSVPFERDGFFETELARRTETYGQLAQVWSTYVSRRTPQDAQPFQRGINSITLTSDGTRWWIVNLVWQAESDKQPLPERYLQSQ